jgi:hypothetical protein
VLPPFLLEDAAGRGVNFPAGRAAVICFLKEDCPTCNEVTPLLEALYRAFGDALDVHLVGQTTEGNALLAQRHALTAPVLDDSRLKVSFAYDIDTVPTLFLADADGRETRVLTGFVRDEWQALAEHLATLTGLPAPAVDWSGLPAWRPGCGSLSVDPVIAERLRAESENSPLRARRIEIAVQDDPFEFMFDQGFSERGFLS